MMLRTDRLVALRKEHGLIQKKLAGEIGLERSTYVRYENGGIQPPNDMLIKLADYFNVTTDYLLGKSDDPTRRIPFERSAEAQIDGQSKGSIKLPDNIEFAFGGGYKELDDEDRNELIKMADRMLELKRLREIQKKEGR